MGYFQVSRCELKNTVSLCFTPGADMAYPRFSNTRFGVLRPRPVITDCQSRCWDWSRDFAPCGLNIETENETLSFGVSKSRPCPRLWLHSGCWKFKIKARLPHFRYANRLKGNVRDISGIRHKEIYTRWIYNGVRAN